jgi:tRNA-splicing ligase RtcB
MDLGKFERTSEYEWRAPATGKMRVPAIVFADAILLGEMDDKVLAQMSNVATLPGVVTASYAMPDAHWGYGFPIGGVAAFDPEADGVVSAGGVGFDISCGVRCLRTGLTRKELDAKKVDLADWLFTRIPAGLGSRGRIRLDDQELDAMLLGGAAWAVARGWGLPEDLERIEENGRMAGAKPDCVSQRARERQRAEMGTLGSGNHYLEVQEIAEVFAREVADQLGLRVGEIVVSLHCGSRGLGHQVGTDFLRRMLLEAPSHGLDLPDRELACAPLRSALGEEYLGAMRAATNCAFANREILTHLTREVFAEFFPENELALIYDVSHNTCKLETHVVNGVPRRLFVHRKGATRAFGPGHPELTESLRSIGQPVLIGGSMGTESHVLVGTELGMTRAFGSACHGAGRRMSRHAALREWRGRELVDDLARGGIIIRTPSFRGVAEEAPGAYKDVARVVTVAERAGLARRVARLTPLVCVKG